MTKKGTDGTDRQLHRYFDGDLPAEEREALEREIANDEVLSRKLTALGDVSTLIRGAAEQASLTEAESGAMWAAIEKGAGLSVAATSDAKAARPALRLVTGGADASAGGAGSEAVVPTASKAIAPEDPAARRRRAWGVGIGMLALAAAAALAFLGPGDQPSDPIAEEVPAPIEESVDPPDSMRTEVLAVDFGTNVGTIFAVEGTEGQRYAVVWLDDAVKIDEGAASPEEELTPN